MPPTMRAIAIALLVILSMAGGAENTLAQERDAAPRSASPNPLAPRIVPLAPPVAFDQLARLNTVPGGPTQEQLRALLRSPTPASPLVHTGNNKGHVSTHSVHKTTQNPPSKQPPARPSRTERIFREHYDTPLAANLSQYGYDLFTAAATDTVRHAVPGPNYILGPGDEVLVRISGTGADRRVLAQVAPDGSIDVPGMGVTTVAGQTLARAEATVTELARGYARGVDVRLSLARLRDIEVYVLGEVAHPGLTRVPAFSTVLSGLYAAGGIPKSGSLRRVQLKRGGRTLHILDLYDLLLSGDRRGDAQLRDGDVVFVPRLGPTLAVAGAVRAPGIYELRGEANAGQVLKLAGGLLPHGRVEHVQLRRYMDGAQFHVRELDAAGGLYTANIRAGDLLEVTAVDPEFSPAVRLSGHVRYPRSFEHRPGLTLATLLPGPEALKPGAIADFGLITRHDPATSRTTTLTFPLSKVLAGTYDAPLEPRDEVRILAREEFGISEPVQLRGAVHKPGDYEHTPGLTLVDLLAQGGGLAFGAEPGRIELSRTELVAGQAVTTFRTLSLAKDSAYTLAPFDVVFVSGIKDARTARTATIDGEVRYPGIYRLRDGETISGLIRRAGGFTANAYFYGAKFTSERARVIQQESIDRLVRELSMFADRALAEQAQTGLDAGDGAARARAGVEHLLASVAEVEAEGRVAIVLADVADFAESVHDFALADGDVLVIPPKPSFVSVVGSVFTPSSFLFRNGSRVQDYLAQSGGPTKNADVDHMYVLKANGEVASAAQSGLSRSRLLKLELMPGDTVVVPEDFERVPYLKLFTGVSDILFKLATTAGIAFAAL